MQPIIIFVAYKCPFYSLDWFCSKGVQRERLPLGEQVSNNRVRFWYNLLHQLTFGVCPGYNSLEDAIRNLAVSYTHLRAHET